MQKQVDLKINLLKKVVDKVEKITIYLVSSVISISLLVDIVFIFLHFFNEELIKQIIK